MLGGRRRGAQHERAPHLARDQRLHRAAARARGAGVDHRERARAIDPRAHVTRGDERGALLPRARDEVERVRPLLGIDVRGRQAERPGEGLPGVLGGREHVQDHPSRGPACGVNAQRDPHRAGPGLVREEGRGRIGQPGAWDARIGRCDRRVLFFLRGGGRGQGEPCERDGGGYWTEDPHLPIVCRFDTLFRRPL